MGGGSLYRDMVGFSPRKQSFTCVSNSRNTSLHVSKWDMNALKQLLDTLDHLIVESILIYQAEK